METQQPAGARLTFVLSPVTSLPSFLSNQSFAFSFLLLLILRSIIFGGGGGGAGKEEEEEEEDVSSVLYQ